MGKDQRNAGEDEGGGVSFVVKKDFTECFPSQDQQLARRRYKTPANEVITREESRNGTTAG
jgi:hypothetical protein